MLKRKLGSSKLVALIAVFAAVNIVSDSFMSLPEFPSGVWYSWVFLLTPLVAFILGPVDSFFSILVGVIIGHYVYFRGPYEFIFTLGAPVGAFIGGLTFQNRNRIPIIYYTILIIFYFLTPITYQLPIWGIWDVLLAFCILLLFNLLINSKSRLLICSLICLEADVLFRIFVFVPLNTYQTFYGFTLEIMKIIWMGGALITPIQVGLSLIFTSFAYPHVVKVVEKYIGKE